MKRKLSVIVMIILVQVSKMNLPATYNPNDLKGIPGCSLNTKGAISPYPAIKDFPPGYNEAKTLGAKVGLLSVYKTTKAKNKEISTYYTYNPFFNEDGKTSGYSWMSDCSCYVGYILQTVSLQAFQELPLDNTVKPPAVRANHFQQFFTGLNSGNIAQYWTGVNDITQTQQGDILAWGLYTDDGKVQQGDTGHVMIMVSNSATNPTVCTKLTQPMEQITKSALTELSDPKVKAVAAYSCWVNDASDQPHHNDDRIMKMPGKPNTEGTGIGRGQVVIFVNAANSPVGFTFLIKDTAHLQPKAVVSIGRLKNSLIPITPIITPPAQTPQVQIPPIQTPSQQIPSVLQAPCNNKRLKQNKKIHNNRRLKHKKQKKNTKRFNNKKHKKNKRRLKIKIKKNQSKESKFLQNLFYD